MKKSLGLGAFLVAVGCLSSVQAGVPTQMEPQVGFAWRHQFGGTTQSGHELGFTLNYSNTYDYAMPMELRRSRPALMDLRFTDGSLTKFNLYGMNALVPKLALNEGEESSGGFLSKLTDNISWGVVGMAALGAGIYYVSEEDRDDRKEAAGQANTGGTASGAGGAGGTSGGAGGTSGGTTGTPLDVVLDPVAGAAGGGLPAP